MRLEPIKGKRIAVTAYLRPSESDNIHKAANDAKVSLTQFARECMMIGFNMRMNERKPPV